MSDVDPSMDIPLETEDELDEESKSKPLPPLPQSSDQLQALVSEAGVVNEDAPDQEDPYIEVRGVHFHTVEVLPAAVAMDMARLGDSSLSMAKRASVSYNVIIYTVVKEERPDFETLLKEADPAIEIDELMEIMKQLVEQVTNRPPK